MTLTVTRFVDEYEQLSAWTGQSIAELRAEEDHHSEDRGLWIAWDGDRVVGLMQPWRRPDGKLGLYFGQCVPAALPALAATQSGEAYATLPETEAQPLLANGFIAYRRQFALRLPVTELDTALPAGIGVVSAADVALEPLMLLDCALREDVPGSEGWQPDPVWFREETYDSPFFDPTTYLVATDGDRYIGICRVWNGPDPQPKLGLIGVLPEYRRRGIATALLGKVFAALRARGIEWVISDADEDNPAYRELQEPLGATVTGVDVELRRPA